MSSVLSSEQLSDTQTSKSTFEILLFNLIECKQLAKYFARLKVGIQMDILVKSNYHLRFDSYPNLTIDLPIIFFIFLLCSIFKLFFQPPETPLYKVDLVPGRL